MSHGATLFRHLTWPIGILLLPCCLALQQERPASSERSRGPGTNSSHSYPVGQRRYNMLYDGGFARLSTNPKDGGCHIWYLDFGTRKSGNAIQGMFDVKCGEEPTIEFERTFHCDCRVDDAGYGDDVWDGGYEAPQ